VQHVPDFNSLVSSINSCDVFNNASSTTVYLFPVTCLKKIARCNDLSLRVGSDVITPVNAVRDLGVTSDSELTMQRHVNKVASACFYHIRRLKQIRRLIGPELTAILMSAFVLSALEIFLSMRYINLHFTYLLTYLLSKLDYCNAVLAGLPKSTIAPLQRAQNAAARLIGLVAPRDHVTSTLQQLHWLPVQYRITHKLCLLMHLIHMSQALSYLTDIVTQTASVTSRTRLRFGSSRRYEQWPTPNMG